MATRVEPAAHWSSKLLLLYVYALLQFAYTWFLVRRLKAGPQRLLVSLPALVGSLLLPLVLDPFCQAEAMLITPLVSGHDPRGLRSFSSSARTDLGMLAGAVALRVRT